MDDYAQFKPIDPEQGGYAVAYVDPVSGEQLCTLSRPFTPVTGGVESVRLCLQSPRLSSEPVTFGMTPDRARMIACALYAAAAFAEKGGADG